MTMQWRMTLQFNLLGSRSRAGPIPASEGTGSMDSDEIADIEISSLNIIDRKIIAAAILGVDITEVYSPERVAQVAGKYGLTAGTSMDLTTGGEFDTQADRTSAEKIIYEEKPMLLVGSPPCTYMSILQELNKWINKDNQEWLD